MDLCVVGGGLAGTEAAWQAAEHGLQVTLYEMRPKLSTGAHQTDRLAELVCSNSLGSNLPNKAPGLLKTELRKMNSLLIACADASSLPAGGALAVDRERFSGLVEENLNNHPNIKIVREEVRDIPSQTAIIASGPLTSKSLSEKIVALTGESNLFFYDAIAPIIYRDSIDMTVAFRGNRYGKDDQVTGDYINCPFNEEAYQRFYHALLDAERLPLKPFDRQVESGVDAGKDRYFQGCQPVEIIAQRGIKALAFGPMRPVGLFDPHTNQRPFAVVQLRQDNLLGDIYNLVGFQTNLMFGEQKRVFRMIPGLEKARFARYGQMHRNTFIASPLLLNDSLNLRSHPHLFFAGQITGIEGYAGNIASGLIAGINAACYLRQKPPFILPETTITGALIHYITHASMDDFQPMKAIFGLFTPPSRNQIRNKLERYKFYQQRALADLDNYLSKRRM